LLLEGGEMARCSYFRGKQKIGERKLGVSFYNEKCTAAGNRLGNALYSVGMTGRRRLKVKKKTLRGKC